MQERRRTHRWLAAAGLAVAILAAGCGGSGDDDATAAPDRSTTTAEASPRPSASPSQSQSQSTTTTEATTTSTTEAPTTTTTEPALTTEDLTGALLNPQEMSMIFSATGNQQAIPPSNLIMIDACGTTAAFQGFEPGATAGGVFQTADQSAYWSYVGWYPDEAEDVYGATAVPDGCADLAVRDDGLGLEAFPVTAGAPAATVPPDAPEHTRALAFTDSQGATYHEAVVQDGDFVMVLFYTTSQGLSEAGMSSYLAYALGRFQSFTAGA